MISSRQERGPKINMLAVFALGYLLVYSVYAQDISLSPCGNDKTVELVGTKEDNTVRCSGILEQYTVIWMLIQPSRETSVGQCGVDNKCTNFSSIGYLATRPSANTSLMTINAKTYMGYVGNDTLACQASKVGQSSYSDRCKLDIIYQSHVTCNAQFNTEEPQWTVSGICTITKAFSFLGRYTCRWFSNNGMEGVQVPDYQTNHSSPRGISESSTMNPYVSFTCSFLIPFPTDSGIYSYNATVYPGTVQITANFSGSSAVENPQTPNHTCPDDYIKEGTNLNCTCTTNNKGSPPGTLKWKGGTNEQLQVTSVTSSLNNKTYMCEILRGSTMVSNTTFTLNVAYGPRSVNVSGPSLPFDTDGTKMMTLYCTAFDYNPSVMYAWRRNSSSIVISNASSFTFMATADDDGVKVACTVTNSKYSDISVHSDFYTQNINYPPKVAPTIDNYKSNDILYAGDNLTLVCTVRGGKPLVTRVYFSCDGKQDGVDDTSGYDYVSSSVIFMPLEAGNHGANCTCTANWKITEWYTMTATTRLTVYSKPSSPDVIAASGTAYPFIAGETSDANLVCESSIPGNPPAIYTWTQTAGGQAWNDSQGRGRLTFTKLEPSHNGQPVTCHVSNAFTEKKGPVQDGQRKLEVYYKPIISVGSKPGHNSCDMTSDWACEVTEGLPLNINCSSKSNPPMALIKWTKGGDTVANSSMLSINVTNRFTHTGQYSCDVTTGRLMGFPERDPLTATYNFTVFVTYSTERTELNLNNKFHNVTVNESQSLLITCLANGMPTPNITLVYGREVKNTSVGGRYMVGNWDSRMMYELESVQCQHAGKYLCTAGNAMTNYLRRDEASLFVNCKPRRNFTSLTPEANFEGEPIQLTFDVMAYPSPDWFSFSYLGTDQTDTGNATATRENILSIRCWPTKTVYMATCNITVDSMTMADAGNYMVTVGNDYGITDVRFRLLFYEKTYPPPLAQSGPWAAVGGGMAGAAVVIVVAVAGVVFIRRQRQGSDQAGNGSLLRKTDSRTTQESEMKVNSIYASESDKNEDETMIVNNIYGTSEVTAATESQTRTPQRSDYEDVGLPPAVKPAVKPQFQPKPQVAAKMSTANDEKDTKSGFQEGSKPVSNPTDTAEYASVYKSKTAGQNKSGQNAEAAVRTGTTAKTKSEALQKPAKKPKPAQNKFKDKAQKEKKEGAVNGNMPLSMNPIDCKVYENFGFQNEESKTNARDPPDDQRIAQKDSLVYTTIQFSESQQKKAEHTPPKRETTEYASIVFNKQPSSISGD